MTTISAIKTTVRQSNIELLRIVVMGMIVLHHFIFHGLGVFRNLYFDEPAIMSERDTGLVFVTYCLRTLAAKFQFITCRPVPLPVCSQNGSVALDDDSVGRITVQVSLQKARQTGKISNCGSAFSAHFPEYSFMHEKYTVNFQVCALRGYSCSRIVEIWCTLRYFPAESPKRKQFIQRENRFF